MEFTKDCPMKLFRLFVWVGLFAILSADSFADSADPMPYPPLPEAVTSFGATVAGDALYVFGGHMGRVPGNSLDGLSPHFCRLNLSQPEAGWQTLPMQQSSQSPGLVAWQNQVYRVGGLSFQNSVGEPTVYESLATFARFDPEKMAWIELPPLPIPRSSLDAAVVDGKLYVVGGWNLQGSSAQSGEWQEDALVFDLANEGGAWKPIAKPPFQTRALAAAAHDHKLFVLGGMKSSNQTTKEVHIYHPETDSWTLGPELLSGNSFGGFAISAYATAGKLYYCGGDGTVYALSPAGDVWESVERLLFPRMFHRVVPVAEDQLAVIGGISGGTYQASLEVVPLRSAAPDRVKSAKWTVNFSGAARHSQALLVHGGALFAFGGNNSPKPHDFAASNFVDEAFRFDLAARTVETLPKLPQPMQSGAAVLIGPRIDQSIYLLGGLSPREDQFSSTDLIQQYRLRSQAWSDEVRHLPASRAMFSAAVHQGTAWMFGGAQSGTAGRGLVSETWSWNPAEDDEVQTLAEAALPVPTRSFGGALMGDRYFVVGGLGENSQIVAKAQVFDFTTKAWSEIPAPQHARVFPSLVVSGGKLYLSGGFARVDGHFAGATAVEVFDPASQTWSTAFDELAPTLAEMTMLEFQDRLLFYNIDKDQPGIAHFMLVDPSPQSPGQSAIVMEREERSPAAEMVSRLMRLDRNRDGKLATDEVGNRFQQIVTSADTDGDGAATREEIEAHAQQQAADGTRPMPR